MKVSDIPPPPPIINNGIDSPRMQRLRHITRYFYDLQKLRIASGNRDSSTKVELSDEDKEFLRKNSDMLENLEKETLTEVARLLKEVPIAYGWLGQQRGIGPTMAAMLVSYVNIQNCHTVSKLWAWCGLKVVIGADGVGVADRRRKGEKARFDPWLKSKVLAVMGGNLLKACGRDPLGYYLTTSRKNAKYDPRYGKKVGDPERLEIPDDAEDYFIRLVDITQEPTPEQIAACPPWDKTVSIRRPYGTTPPWRKFYDDYKHRKESMRLDKCAGCDGTGIYKLSSKEGERLELLTKLSPEKLRDEEKSELADLTKAKGGRTCGNCQGTGGPAPWGRSQQHRHNAALRYMVKMFLAQFWEEWRKLEGLPVRPSYAEEYLNKRHHESDAFANH